MLTKFRAFLGRFPEACPEGFDSQNRAKNHRTTCGCVSNNTSSKEILNAQGLGGDNEGRMGASNRWVVLLQEVTRNRIRTGNRSADESYIKR